MKACTNALGIHVSSQIKQDVRAVGFNGWLQCLCSNPSKAEPKDGNQR